MEASIHDQVLGGPSSLVRWSAAALSFVAPGAGQSLGGRLPRGLTIALVSAGLGLVAVSLFATLPGSWGIALPVIGLVFWRACCAYDAYSGAGTRQSPKPVGRAVGNLLAFAVVALGIDGTTYSFAQRVVGAWRLPSGSMAPSILADEYIITRPLRRPPRVGHIVVFRSPVDPTQSFVKRIVAGPGDTVAMTDHRLALNGHPVTEPYAHYEEPDVDPVSDDFVWQAAYLARPIPEYRASRSTWGPLVVPTASYFVLGDDRDNSLDSRYLGFVEGSRIIGMPTRVYFSRDSARGRVRWSRIGTTIQDP